MHDHVSLLSAFALAMALVVLVPRLMERFGLPGVLGFLFIGVLLGPQGAQIIGDGPAMRLFSELGKLLFMFFVGFDIELEEFNKSKGRSLLFGTATFLLPFAAGVAVARCLGYGANTSVLMGSIIASHTLLAYPLLTKLGLVKRESVLVVVGGTVFTDIAAMLVLAICVTIHTTGFSWTSMAIQLVELAIFVPLVVFGLSTLTRKAIVRFGQTPEARVVILLVVIVIAAEAADLIRLEGIVGAFLGGIAVKRAVRGKFAVEQLEVVARAMFIPAFFVATGFLVNFSTIGHALFSRPILVIGLLLSLLAGKWLAAAITARVSGWSSTERALIWSLSIPQMAATLASAVVGFQSKNAAGEPLLSEGFVNATLVIVVATCIAGPILSRRFAKALVAAQKEQQRSSPAPAPASSSGPSAP